MSLINYLSRIQFDFGAIETLADELTLAGIERPLLVSDPGVAAAGHVARVRELAGGRRLAVFDGTPSNPTEAALLEAMALYQEQGCDGVIALGGGSAIDLAKAVALLISHGGVFAAYEIRAGGSQNIGAIAPLLAIPTAAGTGAEVGRAASLTLLGGHKVAAVNLNLIPRAVICDPELTLTLPAMMTAATGMDALSHGIEAYLSTRENPPAGAMALDCVRRVAAHIERAVADGSDREARWQMMMGALEGGLVLQKGLGAVHAMSHPLGEMDLHHGVLNAVLLPAALRFNESHAADAYGDLRAAMGLRGHTNLGAWIGDLNRRLGLPAGLREMGVGDDQIAALALAASKDHLAVTNPRPAAPEDYAAMLRAAM